MVFIIPQRERKPRREYVKGFESYCCLSLAPPRRSRKGADTRHLGDMEV